MHPGQRLGSFEVSAAIGEGGMGEVWQATDSRLGREVALKVLPAGFADDGDRHARFEREAKVLASLNHPNVATLFGLEHLEGQHVLVMELVEGEDLSKHIADEPIPASEAINIALQIAEALEAAHEQGIVHRDLKPANIMLCPDGSVKVLDFGLAKAWEAEDTEHSLSLSPTLTKHVTAAGVILGTAAYMSPEQARGKLVDRRADIWAFGVVLWEMLTGEQAYHGETITDIIAAVITREPSWQDLPEEVPRRLITLLRRCLDKDPRQRLQAIGEARIELEAIASGNEPEQTAAPIPQHRAPGGRTVWQIAAAVLLATTLVAGWLAVRVTERPERIFKASLPLPEGTIFSLDQASPGPVAVSPDGEKIAFSALDQTGTILLWVRRVTDSAARPLTGTDGAAYSFWSPDSRQIAFFTGDGKLRKIDAAGGPPVTICEAVNGKGGSWSHDGRILFAPAHNTPIHMVSAAGGEPRPVTELSEAISSHRFPHWLPDDRFLFLARSSKGIDEDRIRAASVNAPGGSDEVLRASSNVVVTPERLLFLREGTLMVQDFDPHDVRLTGDAVPIAEDVLYLAGARWGVFSASNEGLLVFQQGNVRRESELVWLDREGRELSQLGGGVFHRDLTLSPDGHSAAVEVIDEVAGASDLWIYNVNRGLKTRFTFHSDMDWFPTWSPDGSTVAFASNRGEHNKIYAKGTAGSETEKLLLEVVDHEVAPEAWSPDGEWLVFVQADQSASFDIWSLPVAGGEPIPVVATSFNEVLPALAPNGRWLAYVSNESGRNEVYVTTFPEPARRWQVSTAGATCPRWSHDGDELYILNPDGSLAAVEVTDTNDAFTVGETHPLFSWTSPPTIRRPYDVAPDGRFLVNRSTAAAETAPLTAVLNWDAELAD